MRKKENAKPETIRIGLSDEDARFIERQRAAIIDTRTEVFRCLRIVALLNQDADFMADDEKQFLCGLVDKWERMYAPQLLPKKLSLKERKAEVTEEVTQKIEEILGDYLPDCQAEVIRNLRDRLPVKERRL